MSKFDSPMIMYLLLHLRFILCSFKPYVMHAKPRKDPCFAGYCCQNSYAAIHNTMYAVTLEISFVLHKAFMCFSVFVLCISVCWMNHVFLQYVYQHLESIHCHVTTDYHHMQCIEKHYHHIQYSPANRNALCANKFCPYLR